MGVKWFRPGLPCCRLTIGVLLLAAVAALAVTAPREAHAEDLPPTVTVMAVPTGQVEVKWTASAGSTGYAVHRGSVPDFEPTSESLLYELPAVRSFADFTATPGTRYWYRVVPTGGTGSSAVVADVVSTPVDRQRTAVLQAIRTDGTIRLGWRLPVGSDGPVRVYVGGPAVAGGDLGDARLVGEYAERFRTVDWTPTPGATAAFAVTDRTGAVVATAEPAGLAHPRIALTPARLAAIRDAVARPGTPNGALQTLKQRVETDSGQFLRAAIARDAAFLYAVTREPRYADIAFTAFEDAARFLPTQAMGLEVGNTVTPLAHAYDWAYNGWTEEQRAAARKHLKVSAAFFGTYHAGNIEIDGDKASNWVAIIRGAELTQHLALRGDGDYGRWDERIPTLVDELRRHLDEAYEGTGWNQEGWDYLSYALSGLAPAVFSAQASGIHALDAAWQRPQFADLYLHTSSLRHTVDRVQFGVGERNGALDAGALLLGQAPRRVLPSYLWTWERTSGHRALQPQYGGMQAVWSLVNWPTGVTPQDPDHGPETARRAQLSDEAGAYQFRNRYQNSDDVLVGVTNRNHAHIGWAGPETFALSLIGQGTTWARSPAKDVFSYNLYSAPLVDGKPGPHGSLGGTRGQGSTLAASAYPGQGGGYVSLDGSRNYDVDMARREIAVDLRSVAGADAVVAVSDSFADDRSRRWDWQLSPEPGVQVSHDGATFLFRRDDAWLKGWLLEPAGAAMSVTDGAFRITRTGTSAGFRVVLATGRGEPPAGVADGTVLALGNSRYDTAQLAAFAPGDPEPVAPARATVWMETPTLPFMRERGQTVTAVYEWWQPKPSRPVVSNLDVPVGWTAAPVGDHTPVSLRRGERITRSWVVTAEAQALGQHTLAARVGPTGEAVSDSAAVRLVRTNLALGRPTAQSSTQGGSERAVDGNTDGFWGHGSVAHTLQEVQPWWQVDLGSSQHIEQIAVWGRTDCCADRVKNYYVLVSDQPFAGSLAEALAQPGVWAARQTSVAGTPSTVPVGRAGRYVRIQLADTTPNYLQLAEVEVFPDSLDLAVQKPAEQSTTVFDGVASRAVDGNTAGGYAGGSVTHTDTEVQPWWQVDLTEQPQIAAIEVWNRSDSCCSARLSDFYVLVSDAPFGAASLADLLAAPGVTAIRTAGQAGRPSTVPVGRAGRYVRVQLAGTVATPLSLAEVRVLRAP